jgi:arginine decarboxylase
MPNLDENKLYIGLFNTGAYQEALSGYGGIKHCLIPSPKHVVISRDENNELDFEVFAEEQSSENMLKTLGY